MSSPFGFDTEPVVTKQPDVLINNPSPMMHKKPVMPSTTVSPPVAPVVSNPSPLTKPPPPNAEKFQSPVSTASLKRQFDPDKNYRFFTASVLGGFIGGIILSFLFISGIGAVYLTYKELSGSQATIWIQIINYFVAFVTGPFYLLYYGLKRFSFRKL